MGLLYNNKYYVKYKHFTKYLEERQIDNENINSFKLFEEYLNYGVYDIKEGDIEVRILNHFLEFVYQIKNLDKKILFWYDFVIYFTKYNAFLKNKKCNKLTKIITGKLKILASKMNDNEKSKKLEYIIDIYKTYYI